MSTLRVSKLAGTAASLSQVTVAAGKKLKIGADASLDLSGLDTALQLPAGSTANRPGSPATGYWRYNTDNNAFEVYTGSAWTSLQQAATGAAAITRDGSSAIAAADNPGEAYDAGLTTGNEVWLKVGDTNLPYTYDPTDRFGTGDYGWALMNHTWLGTYGPSHLVDYRSFGSPHTIMPSFGADYTARAGRTTITQGRFRIGLEQGHAGGNSLCTIRIQMPRMTKARYYKDNITSGGNQAADYGNFTQNFDGINRNSPYENNGSGYWQVIWSGRDSNQGGSISNDWMIMDNGNNNTDNYVSSVQSFGGGKPSTDPWAIWGTSDAHNEYVYYLTWRIWFH